MRTFLWTMLIIELLAVVIYMVKLGWGLYPETRVKKAGEAVVCLAIGLGLVAWIVVLLIRVQP